MRILLCAAILAAGLMLTTLVGCGGNQIAGVFSIAGNVVLANGTAVAGVTVSLVQNGREVVVTSTNAAGTFGPFLDLPEGTYTIQVAAGAASGATSFGPFFLSSNRNITITAPAP